MAMRSSNPFLILVGFLIIVESSSPIFVTACASTSSSSISFKNDGSKTVLKVKREVQLPEKLIVGYTNWGQCDDKLITAVQNGVNVLIWFSIDLSYNSSSGQPYINRGPDTACVSRIYNQLQVLGLETIHLISIGGWNSPHPDTRSSAAEAFAEFSRWNAEVMSRPDEGFFGYDGIDWDIEGNDDFSSPFNHLSVQALDFMGQFSQLAKRSGLIVSMAPAESYLDPTTSEFDRDLNHTYTEWDPIIPGFKYRGRNPYSYLLSRYGTFEPESESSGNEVGQLPLTFDFVTIQLYEGYSHALCNTTVLGQPASEYISNIVRRFDEGWLVDFSSDADMNWVSEVVRVEPGRLVIGVANGWADNDKFLLLPSLEICLGYKILSVVGMEPRGFAFWNIFDEGHRIPTGVELWLATDLNRILKVRGSNETSEFC